MSTTKDSGNIITPVAKLSYPHFITAQAAEEGQKAKFSAALIWLAGVDLTVLRNAAIEAAIAKFGATMKVGGKEYPTAKAFELELLRNPLRTGGDALKKGYPEGSTFTNARSDRRPGLVMQDGKTLVTDAEQIASIFYPGALVRASLRAYFYDKSGNKGISFALNNVQFAGHGERLDNRVAADAEFGSLDETPEDVKSLL